MKRLIPLVMLFAVGCTANENKAESTSTADNDSTVKTVTVANKITVDGCYMQVLQRDTFAASLQQQGNLVTGKLSFNNYEKDASSGTVSGNIEGDIVKLNYNFMSEGMNSVMEVYFKYQNGNLLQGTGDMKTKGDTSYFASPANVNFNGTAFKKIDCGSMPAKYK